MPFEAILTTDLAGMARSWVIRIWLVLMAFQVLITIVQALEEGLALEALANLLGTFPLIWSIFIIIISSGAVSSDAGVMADSVLSKSVTRSEYILAKLAGRLVVVVGLYLIVVLPAIFIIRQNIKTDLSAGGIAWSVLTIGLLLVLLTTLAVMFSTVFNRTLVAVVVVWFIWYSAGAMLVLVGGETFSPVHIIDSLPAVLNGDYKSADQWRTVIGFGLLSLGSILVAVQYFARKDL